MTARAKLLDGKENPITLDPISLNRSISFLGNGTAAVPFSLPFKNVSPGTYHLMIEIVEGVSAARAVLQTDIEF